MDKTTIPCHIITLSPEAETVQELKNALAAQGIEVSLYQGVDGRRDFPALDDRERLDQQKALRRNLTTLTTSEIGCYLSHYRLIRSAYEAGESAVCIMEDDVMVEPEFGQVLREISGRMPQLELVRLMGLRIRKRKIVATLADGKHQLVRPERGWCGGQCYVLNRAGMKKVIEHGARIFEPIDKLYDHFWEYDLQVFGIEPHVAFERPHESSIVKSHVEKTRVNPWQWFLHKLTKGAFSLWRHSYLTRYRARFYPADMPDGRPGRTQRLH